MNPNQDLVITHCETELQETRKRAWEDGLSSTPEILSGQMEMKEAFFNKIHRCLVLAEQRIHGDLGSSPDFLRAEMDRRRTQLSEAPAATDPYAASIQQPDAGRCWTFDWRRSLACLAIAGIAAVIGYNAGFLNAASLAALFLLAGLTVLGPWTIPADITAIVRTMRGACRNWQRERRRRALEAEIRRLEDQLSAAVLRRQQADLWIDTREQLLRAEYEIQRARAARAANRLQISELFDNASFDGGSHVALKEFPVR
jgi:hypothetical protein